MWRCAVVLLWATAMVRTSASVESLESSLQKPDDPELTKNDTMKRNGPELSVRQVSSSSSLCWGLSSVVLAFTAVDKWRSFVVGNLGRISESTRF